MIHTFSSFQLLLFIVVDVPLVFVAVMLLELLLLLGEEALLVELLLLLSTELASRWIKLNLPFVATGVIVVVADVIEEVEDGNWITLVTGDELLL